MLEAFPSAIIFRPSIIFGTDDGFFNLLGSLARMLPVMPLFGATTRFQPVYVGDVADAFAAAVNGTAKPGRIYELGGPEIETQRELVERVLAETNRTNPVLALPEWVGRLIAMPMSLLPEPLVTSDQLDLAADRQCRLRRCDPGQADAAGPRHHPAAARSRAAILHVALQPQRPVRPPDGVKVRRAT